MVKVKKATAKAKASSTTLARRRSSGDLGSVDAPGCTGAGASSWGAIVPVPSAVSTSAPAPKKSSVAKEKKGTHRWIPCVICGRKPEERYWGNFWKKTYFGSNSMIGL